MSTERTMQENLFSRNPVVTHGLDCFWLLEDSSLAHCYLGEENPTTETIALPIVLKDVQGLECDCRGRYLCALESKRVTVIHLSLQKQGMKHCLSREGPLHVSSLEFDKSDSSIVCVRCHPRITDCLVVVFQDGTLYVYNPLSSPKPVMELTVAKNPLDVCFGSSMGSDQFCLYVLDASQCISIVTPFPLIGYELPFDVYAKLLRKGHSWLLSWEEVDGGRVVDERGYKVDEKGGHDIDKKDSHQTDRKDDHGTAYVHNTHSTTQSAAPLMQTTANTKWETRVIPLCRGDTPIRRGRLFIEPVSIDAVSVCCMTNDSRLSVWIRFLDEPLDEESLVLVRSLSFASMGCVEIDCDVVPFSYLLRFADRVVNVRLPWLYDVVADDGDGDAMKSDAAKQPEDANGVEQTDSTCSLTPQYATVMDGAVKGSLTAANSPFLGHVLCEVTGKTIHIRRMDKEPLSGISLADIDLDIQKDKESSVGIQGDKQSSVGIQGDKQSSVGIQGDKQSHLVIQRDTKQSTSNPLDNSPLDSLLEEMRANATDLVSRYNEQLNASANNDDHVSYSVLSRILKEYMTPWIASLYKVKKTLQQEASARADDLRQAEDASSFLLETLDEVESENAALEAMTKKVIGKQEQLEETLQRVLEKLQDVLEMPSEQEVLLRREASSLCQRIQEMRHRIRDAEESVEVVEELRRKSQGQLKSCVVDKHVMRELLGVQDTLQDSMACKRDVEAMYREYESAHHQVSIERRMKEMDLLRVCWHSYYWSGVMGG